MILIDNGISADRPYSMIMGINRCLFWLPDNSPYGNFQLKLLRIEQLTYTANLRLKESFESWDNIFATGNGFGNTHYFAQHHFAKEQAIYLIRRVADELISLIWCLSEWEINGNYPSDIKIDCIGKLLKATDKKIDFKLTPFFTTHQWVLKTLNEISNAFKHSFIHSDSMNIIGKDEPCVHALDRNYGNASPTPKLHIVSLTKLVNDFSIFYNVALDWLKDFSKRHHIAANS